MKKRLISAVFIACTAASLYGQVEVPPQEITQEWLKGYHTVIKENRQPFADHFKRIEKTASDKQKTNAFRVAQDFSAVNAPFVHYNVAPMSEVQYLPDAYPYDGEAGKAVRILAAQNEYEPGSFVIYPLQDLGKVQFTVSDLKTKDGKIFSKDQLDLKTVKVWYQAGNGWYSYFQDKGLKLCPELLLNDEDLIKVDTEKVANYARLTEKDGSVSYFWLTQPPAVDDRTEDLTMYRPGSAFFSMKENFKDAPVFAGATLNEGEFKQFFLTAHVTPDHAPGIYSGSITLSVKGKTIGAVPVRLRVLPFRLPAPMQYQNPDKPFRTKLFEYVGIDIIRQLNGNDMALAEKQLISILKNEVRHNQTLPTFRDAFDREDLIRASGKEYDFIVSGSMKLTSPAEMRYHANRMKDLHKQKFGHHRFRLTWGDEYGISILRGIMPMIKIYKDAGFLFYTNSRYTYVFAGFLADMFAPPTSPDFSSHIRAQQFNFINPGNEYGWYANQHVGSENPAYVRRQNGLGPWRAGFTLNENYAHHLDGYNDIRGGNFRSMNYYYSCGDGVLDTIGWEGFREGIDDIRYATLIQQLARPLLGTTPVEADYAARKALQFLAGLYTDDYDISTARLEMIRHILELKKYSKEK